MSGHGGPVGVVGLDGYRVGDDAVVGGGESVFHMLSFKKET